MDQAERPRAGFTLAVVIATGMVLVSAGAGVALLTAGGHVAPSRGMAAAAAEDGLDLLTLPAPVAAHYHAAAESPDVYGQVPCFCGCETMLGHRSLLDCFVRPQGGWEPHAAGCAVCLDESEMLQTMLAGGSPPGEIRAEIVDAYTAPTA